MTSRVRRLTKMCGFCTGKGAFLTSYSIGIERRTAEPLYDNRLSLGILTYYKDESVASLLSDYTNAMKGHFLAHAFSKTPFQRIKLW